MRNAFVAVFCSFAMAAHAQNTSVYFPVGSAALNAQAQKTIDSLFYNEVIQTSSSIRIYGYADEPGRESMNQTLSEKRAEAVRKYLLESGIKAEKIKACEGRGVQAKGISETARKATLILERKEVAAKPESTSVAGIAELKPNQTATLDKLFFQGGMSSLLPQSLPVLKQLLRAMQDNPNLKIRLEGHVCCAYANERPRGSDYFEDTSGYDLSRQRAYTVYRYLLDSGIHAARMSYKGFGTTQPKSSLKKLFGYTDLEQAMNRRVEVRVISNTPPANP